MQNSTPRLDTLLPIREAESSKPTLTPHFLRHNYVTLLYEAGVDPLIAMKIVGHTDYKTTANIYAHVGGDAEEGDGEQREVYGRRAKGRQERRFRAGARFSSFLDVVEWVEVWYNRVNECLMQGTSIPQNSEMAYDEDRKTVLCGRDRKADRDLHGWRVTWRLNAQSTPGRDH